MPQDQELEGMVAATHVLLGQVPAAAPPSNSSQAGGSGPDAPRKLRFEG